MTLPQRRLERVDSLVPLCTRIWLGVYLWIDIYRDVHRRTYIRFDLYWSITTELHSRYGVPNNIGRENGQILEGNVFTFWTKGGRRVVKMYKVTWYVHITKVLTVRPFVEMVPLMSWILIKENKTKTSVVSKDLNEPIRRKRGVGIASIKYVNINLKR